MKQHQTPKLKYRNLGSSGLKVSELCLGTMTFGPSSFKMPYADEDTSFKMMDRFAEFGGNFLDLADFYGPFESEKIVGKWLSTKKREDFVLATKTYLPLGHGPNDKGASRKHIVAALEGTLERLKTSYVDLHCVAIWDNSTSLKETLTTLNDLVRCGKVRYIGASNLGGWQLQKMLDLAKEMGLEQYISLQQQYSLLERHSEGDAFEVCKREGLGILPWGALKSGLLSGQYTSSTDVAAASANPTSRVGWAANSKMPLFNLHGDDHTWNVIKKVEEISKQIDKTVPQVALRWLLHKPQVSSIIIGAKTLEQLEDNLQAGLFQLTDEHVAELDHVSAVPLRYPYSMIAFANASVHHH